MDNPQLNIAVTDLKQSIDTLNEIFRLRSPIPSGQMNFAQRLLQKKSRIETSFEVVKVDLTTARSAERMAFSGNFFYILRVYTTATGVDASGSVSLRFVSNNTVTPAVVTAGQGIQTDFDSVYLTNTAQSGISMDIIIAQDDNFKIVDNRLSTSISSVASITDILAISGVTKLPTGATEVFFKGSCNGATSATIYTNSTGQTVKLIESSLIVFNNTAAISSILMQVHDGSAFTKQINLTACLNSQFHGVNLVHLPPIEIPNGHTVRIGGYDAAMVASATLAYAQGMGRGYYV